MKEYTIIIVDDEREIIEGIIRKVDFQKFGFAVIAAAENGEDALELALKMQPDIVMTDIVMPYMDGLALGEQLQKDLPSTKLIVFSGYDELEYAHKAIKIDVAEYVLKPVNANEIEEILRKLKQQLDEQYESRRNFELLKKKYEESLPILREQFLAMLMEGRITEADFQEQVMLSNINPYAYGYGIVLFEIEKENQSEFSQLIFKEKNALLMTVAMEQMVKEYLEKHMSCSVFLYGSYIAVIVNMKDDDPMDVMISHMNEVCVLAKRTYELILTAGVSSLCRNRWNIRYACKEAIAALDYQLALGCGKPIYFGDVEPDSTFQLSFHGRDEELLSAAIRTKEEQDIKKTIDELFVRIESRVLPIHQYRMYAVEIVVMMMRMMQTYHIVANDIFPKNLDVYDPLKQIDSIDSFKGWLFDISRKLNDRIRKERFSSSSLIVEKVEAYILQNYAQRNLNVDIISDSLHISPSYLSTVFKKVKHESLITYLTEVRLEKAIQLLHTTQDKNYMIAEKIGYTDANYFSYVFKRKYGISPTRYRKNMETA